MHIFKVQPFVKIRHPHVFIQTYLNDTLLHKTGLFSSPVGLGLYEDLRGDVDQDGEEHMHQAYEAMLMESLHQSLVVKKAEDYQQKYDKKEDC